ncbi:MAG TPA: flagellar basal body P-ring protein FlgI [Vicinamibacterales bacterium]
MTYAVAVLSCAAVLAGSAPHVAAQPLPDSPAAEHAAESTVTTVRVGDVARLQGAAPIPLVGYGLVVGLNKTGDRRQTIFPAQTLANMLERFGVAVPAGEIKIENVAAVLVTAELPPFVRQGARLDVTASSIGDARSLQGGTLIPTPLRGPDGTVHALAQGPLSIGGFGGGRSANGVTVNHLTVGRVPGGALVQVGQRIEMGPVPELRLALTSPDFGNAHRLADTINDALGGSAARAIDAATVAVAVPPAYRQAVPDLLARLESLPLAVDQPARVAINERTGTVVIGGGVRLGPAAVAHGNLSVRISTQYVVSQPSAFSRTGETVVVPDERVEVSEGDARLVNLGSGSTLDEVVRALNALGATPRDIIAILQALKSAGALAAEIVIL